MTNEEMYFYSVSSQKIGTYKINGDQSPTFQQVATNVWFGGRLIQKNGTSVGSDRLGSFGKYYPYGQEKGSGNPANGTEKFATYTRDAETGLGYADQRYHGPSTGRFMSPDPYQASSGADNPGSWNRYAYAESDPLNFYDPSGRFIEAAKNSQEPDPYPDPDPDGPRPLPLPRRPLPTGDTQSGSGNPNPRPQSAIEQSIKDFASTLEKLYEVRGAISEMTIDPNGPCAADLKALGHSAADLQAAAADGNIQFRNGLTAIPGISSRFMADDHNNAITPIGGKLIHCSD